jgi:hypothetical protein
MFARAITLQREKVSGNLAVATRTRLSSEFANALRSHLLDGSMYLRKKRARPRLSNISADLVEDFASHTERLTMHVLRYPCIKWRSGLEF